MASGTLGYQLAEFVCETSYSRLPEQSLNAAKDCLLDYLGVALAGSRQPQCTVIGTPVLANDAGNQAAVWSFNTRASEPCAAFVNALMGHALDMDDGHRYANGHPGAVTIPPAIVMAEAAGRSGRKLLEAIVIGYEVFIRLGTAASPDLLQSGFHTTAAVGTFASAAVSAKLLGLQPNQVANALSLAGLQSAGLLEALSAGEMGKSFQVAKSAQSGVLAALLAEAGADGPGSVLEGPKGFFNAFAKKPCNSRSICEGLGAEFGITGVYFKQHAACRHIHSAVDALTHILDENDLKVDRIRSICVETYSVAKNLTGHLAGEGDTAAKFSTPLTMALYLIFGDLYPARYTKAYLHDSRVQELAKKINVTVNPDYDRPYPKQRPAQVTVQTSDHIYRYEVKYAKGEPENPFTADELTEKFIRNASVVFSPEKVAEIRRIVTEIATTDVADLARLLQG